LTTEKPSPSINDVEHVSSYTYDIIVSMEDFFFGMKLIGRIIWYNTISIVTDLWAGWSGV